MADVQFNLFGALFGSFDRAVAFISAIADITILRRVGIFVMSWLC